jgi:dTDP-4-amino-4,6-dideoxygalactose transaminase
LPHRIVDVQAVYHLYVVRVPDGKRDALQEYLRTQGISAGIHYPIPLPYLNAYAYLGHTPADFPESRRASAEILSLPMFPELSDEQIECVAERISAFGL